MITQCFAKNYAQAVKVEVIQDHIVRQIKCFLSQDRNKAFYRNHLRHIIQMSAKAHTWLLSNFYKISTNRFTEIC